MGGLGEAQLPGDLLDGNRRVLKEGPGLGDGLVRDPGADGFAGLAFDDVAEIVGMQVLSRGIVLDAEDLCFGPFQEVTVVLFKCLFEGFDDLGGTVAFVNGIVFRPEVFLYFQQQDDE